MRATGDGARTTSLDFPSPPAPLPVGEGRKVAAPIPSSSLLRRKRSAAEVRGSLEEGDQFARAVGDADGAGRDFPAAGD